MNDIINESFPTSGKVPKNIRIFHGSTVQGLKVLTPHKSFSYPELGPVVFASFYKPFAACLCLDWNDNDLRQGSNNHDYNDMSLWLLHDMDFTKPCSIYELVNDGSFRVLPNHPAEIYSPNRIKVKKEETFDSFEEVIKLYDIDLYNYNTKQPLRNYSGLLSESSIETDNIDIEKTYSFSKEDIDEMNKMKLSKIQYLMFKHYGETKEMSEKAEYYRVNDELNLTPLITAYIKSLDELEDRYNNQYMSLSPKFKSRCNDKSIEVYNDTVDDRYIKMKNVLSMLEKIEPVKDVESDIEQNDISIIDTSINNTLKEHLEYIESIIESKSYDNKQLAELLLDLNDSKNEFTFTESIVVKRFIENKINILKEGNDNSLKPYYSINEMINMGVFSENANDNFYNIESTQENLDWFLEYSLTNSIDFNSWHERLLEQYKDLLIDPSDKNKQRILELAWNPELEPTTKNIIEASKSNKTKKIDIIDIDKISNVENTIKEDNIFNENKTDTKLFPVFIITVFTNSPIGHIIQKFTHCEYTHAGISLESKLDKIFSFNMNNGEGGGLSIESLKRYRTENANANMNLMCIFVKKEDIDKIKVVLDNALANIHNTTYSLTNLINILINRAKKKTDNLSMVCSQFVDYILRSVNIDVTGKANNLVTPADFVKNTNSKIYHIYEGRVSDYNEEKINKSLSKLNKSAKYIKEYNIDTSDEINAILESFIDIDVNPILEYKSFPSVEFSKDGDLLIKNYKKIKFEEEYYKSTKLLKVYAKNNNYDAMAYELSKLWFMNGLLEQKIYSSNDKSKLDEYNLIRGKILNTFNMYLTILCNEKKDFNFEEYYNNTPFSDTISIKKSTIHGVIDIFKKIIL